MEPAIHQDNTKNSVKLSSSKNGNSSKSKNEALQGLRALASLGIFVSHAGIGSFGALGAWGVSVFFVLSGFLMMFNYLPRESMPKIGFGFAWGKIKKLYLLHIVTMLLAAFYAAVTTGAIVKTFWDMVIHSLLIQVWIPNTVYYATLNGTAWYLCASFFLYSLFPLILKLFKVKMSHKKAILYMCLLFVSEILVSIMAFLLGNHDNNLWFCTKWLTYYFPPVRLVDFFMGCCLGYLFLNKSNTRKNYLYEITILILIPLSLLIYVLKYGILGSDSVRYSLLFLPTSVMLIWVVANKKGIIPRMLSLKILVWLGNLSPYIFLIHYVVLKYCRWAFFVLFSCRNVYVIAMISLIITVLFAIMWGKLTKILKK